MDDIYFVDPSTVSPAASPERNRQHGSSASPASVNLGALETCETHGRALIAAQYMYLLRSASKNRRLGAQQIEALFAMVAEWDATSALAGEEGRGTAHGILRSTSPPTADEDHTSFARTPPANVPTRRSKSVPEDDLSFEEADKLLRDLNSQLQHGQQPSASAMTHSRQHHHHVSPPRRTAAVGPRGAEIVLPPSAEKPSAYTMVAVEAPPATRSAAPEPTVGGAESPEVAVVESTGRRLRSTTAWRIEELESELADLRAERR